LDKVVNEKVSFLRGFVGVLLVDLSGCPTINLFYQKIYFLKIQWKLLMKIYWDFPSFLTPLQNSSQKSRNSKELQLNRKINKTSIKKRDRFPLLPIFIL
jgi:hypothetical protein